MPARDPASGLTSAPYLSEDWLRVLLEETPLPVLVVDHQQQLVYGNRGAKRLLGDGLRLGEPFALGDIKTWQIWFNRTVTQGESFEDLPIMVEDGTGASLPLLVSLSPIRRDHAPLGGLVVCREGRLDYQVRRAMQVQEATLNSILEHFPTPFFMVDPDLRVTHINKPMSDLTGYTRDEVMGKMTCGTLLDTVQCGTEDCMLMQVMKTKNPVSGLRRMVRDRQGLEIPVVVYASIITDQNGTVIGGFEAIRNIAHIIEAEKKIEMITELTQEGILMVDERQHILFANSKMAEVLGQPKDELMGRDLGEVLTPQHVKMAADLIKLAEQDHQEVVQFCDTITNNADVDTWTGQYFETCMAASRIGKNILTCIYMRDVTYRIRMHEQLKQTNVFLNNIFRCSVDGIVVIAPNGNPLIYSEGAERILGYKVGEIIADRKGLHQFYPIKLAREMMRRMRSEEYGPPDRLNPTEVTFYNKDGEEVPVRFSAAIIRDKGREVGSVGIFSDLREHRKMQRQLEESQAQLMHAEKIASLGRLSAGVAHEINNPLAGILIYGELLQRQIGAAGEGKEFIDEIINQTMRCQQIVQRLLEFSRQSMGQQSFFNVNQIITRCVDLISRQAMFHDIEFQLDLNPELPQIMGDAGQLQQVVTNLLLNAADAMPGQGRITITSRAEAQVVILTFADNGCGMPLEVREKVFEPFFTTKPPGKGTGLGLAIVYGIIQRHGGTIEVDSAPGLGTTFTIVLPIEAPESAPPIDFL